MEEIPNNHLTCKKTFVNNGISTTNLPQLVSLPDFWLPSTYVVYLPLLPPDGCLTEVSEVTTCRDDVYDSNQGADTVHVRLHIHPLNWLAWNEASKFGHLKIGPNGCWTKNRGGFYPPNHPICFNRVWVSIIFTIHFGGKPTIFGNTQMGPQFWKFLHRIPTIHEFFGVNSNSRAETSGRLGP